MKIYPFLLIILLLPVLGLAVKQIAFILIYGSIFEPLRKKIANKFNSEAKNKLLWEKINELFSCNLCLTAQVSIWVVTIPLFGILFLSNYHFLIATFNLNAGIIPEILFNILACFIFAMSVSALAMVIWGVTEYFPKKIKIEEDFLKSKIQIESMMNVTKTTPAPLEKHNRSKILTIEDFTLENFKKIIRDLDYCSSFNCGHSRRDCREKNLDVLLKKWYKKTGVDNPPLFFSLQSKVSSALKEYFRNGNSSEERIEHLYNEMINH